MVDTIRGTENGHGCQGGRGGDGQSKPNRVRLLWFAIEVSGTRRVIVYPMIRHTHGKNDIALRSRTESHHHLFWYVSGLSVALCPRPPSDHYILSCRLVP